MEDYAIEVKNVSLEFCLYSENVSSIKEYFIKKVKREISKDSFWALKDISFNVKKGEAVGLVGKNGCGKSTMSGAFSVRLPWRACWLCYCCGNLISERSRRSISHLSDRKASETCYMKKMPCPPQYWKRSSPWGAVLSARI